MTSTYQPTSDVQEGHDGEQAVVIHTSPVESAPMTENPASVDKATPAPTTRASFWELDHKPGATFVVFLASLVLLIQTSIDCTPTSQCTDYYAWGLSVAVLSLSFSLLLFLLFTFRNDVQASGDPKLEHRLLAAFLFILWIPGAGILTFKTPYVLTGNAYFACWLAFIASGYLFFQSFNIKFPFEALGYDLLKVCLFLILLASVIELTQASLECPPHQSCTRKQAWALAVGIMSTVISFVTLLISVIRKGLPTSVLKIVSLLLFMIWIPGAGVLTFSAPFRETGNAYFACWGAFLSSGNFFYLAWFTKADDSQVKPAV